MASLHGTLTKTHVHALSQGATITMPLVVDSFPIQEKPGDTINLSTEDELISSYKCRILDMEMIRKTSQATFMRTTLERA